jgi:hypothetical protein
MFFYNTYFWITFCGCFVALVATKLLLKRLSQRSHTDLAVRAEHVNSGTPERNNCVAPLSEEPVAVEPMVPNPVADASTCGKCATDIGQDMPPTYDEVVHM